MNSQKHQVQTLIAEIDALLQSLSPRFSWFTAKSLTRQRQTLARLRQYLVEHQQELAPMPTLTPTTEAQQMLQVLTQEVRGLRASVLQPLRAEVVTLMHQRDALQQEIQQLKAQSTSGLETVASPPLNQQVINEFLQVLMARLQETLTQQVVQVMENHTQSRLAPSLTGIALPETWDAPLQHSTQQLAQIQQLHDRTDQVLGQLDRTLSEVFESLQGSIQTYQDSLTQGVDQMHNLGQQGETLLATLVAQLTQQLQQVEGAASLAPPAHTMPEAEAQRAAKIVTPSVASLSLVDSLDQAEDGLPATLTISDIPQLTLSGLPVKRPPISLPYPGTELRSFTLPSNEPDRAPLITNPPSLPPLPEASLPPVVPPANQDEIHSLTDLLKQLTSQTKADPVVASIAPPVGHLEDQPPLETAVGVAAPGLGIPLIATASTAIAAPDAALYSIFSLEGMDDLFLDPPAPSSGHSPAAQIRQLPEAESP